MKTYLDCYPCFLRQALSAARRAQADDDLQKRILLDTMQALSDLPDDATPPEIALSIHRLVREQTGIDDPYRQDKEEATEHALTLYPRLKRLVETSPDPLQTAVRLAISGNIIDLGVAETYDLEANLQRVLEQTLASKDLEPLRQALATDPSILYLADNAGETVFDRVLIETIDCPVTYAVKASPIINDATREDAVAAGITAIAEVIDNGSNAPGTLLAYCSSEFRQHFEQAELIIAKGQANYESLSRHPAPIFFLLQAKCSVIARDLAVETGDTILKHQ
jgi:uncharacterized protein with ATP-grasp and redox domains